MANLLLYDANVLTYLSALDTYSSDYLTLRNIFLRPDPRIGSRNASGSEIMLLIIFVLHLPIHSIHSQIYLYFQYTNTTQYLPTRRMPVCLIICNMHICLIICNMHISTSVYASISSVTFYHFYLLKSLNYLLRTVASVVSPSSLNLSALNKQYFLIICNSRGSNPQ